MNMLSKLFAIVIVLCCAGVLRAAEPAAAPATRPTTAPSPQQAEEMLKDLRQKLSTVTSVQADFVQEKNLSIFAHTLVIRGRFAVDRPKRLIWHVADPVKYSIRVEGDEVRFWDEDTDHVQSIRIGPNHSFRAAFEQFQGWFLGDYRSLTDSYDVTVLRADPIAVSFEPRSNSPMAKIIKRVEATFQTDNAYLQSIVIHEGSGDTTTIRFLNTRLNQPIPAEIWEIPPHAR